MGEFVELEPARLIVVEEFVEVLAVDNADATETKMVSAPQPPRILNCFAGPGLLAGLAAHHFADPYAYLHDVFERLPQLRSTASDTEDSTHLLPLLPDRWLAEHPESELQMRTNESNAKSARRRTRRTHRRRALARAR